MDPASVILVLFLVLTAGMALRRLFTSRKIIMPDWQKIQNRYPDAHRELGGGHFNEAVKSCLQNIHDPASLREGQSLYITFKSADAEMPDNLRRKHPDTMTIVMQHDFTLVAPENDSFMVTLNFSNKRGFGSSRETLKIPYSAILLFADPSIGFALQRAPS